MNGKEEKVWFIILQIITSLLTGMFIGYMVYTYVKYGVLLRL